MLINRATITVKFEVNVDPVEGWGHDPVDYFNMIKRDAERSIPHYFPTIELVKPIEVRIVNTEDFKAKEQN